MTAVSGTPSCLPWETGGRTELGSGIAGGSQQPESPQCLISCQNVASRPREKAHLPVLKKFYTIEGGQNDDMKSNNTSTEKQSTATKGRLIK